MIRPNTDMTSLDLAAIRARLEHAKGPEFWRSLEEIAETPEFKQYLENEFTPGTSEWQDPVSRRRILQLLGASLALGGLTACTKQPAEKIVPYVNAPEDLVPGKPLFFATAMHLGGAAAGVLVESHMGRPTKVEGNPEHPGSLGATDVFAQASILSLYDPDRSQVVLRNGRVSSWVSFAATIGPLRESLLATRGAGFRILTETVTSPTLGAQMRALMAEMPEAKWHQYEPVARDGALGGALLAYGEPVSTVYRFENADVILSLDADFLATGPGSVRYAREFASRRRQPGKRMNRLYAVEPTPSVTGSMADHRLPLESAEIERFARAVAAGLGVPIEGAESAAPAPWIKAVTEDLRKHKGASVVIAGDQQSPAVHALAHAMNGALGNTGRTVYHTAPLETNPSNQNQSLRELAGDLRAGLVRTILVLGANPVYNAPADLEFGKLFRKASLRIHLGLYDDETSELCQWHIPEAHFLEAWSDARAFDGTVSIVQPLIAPLYGGKSPHEILAAFAGKPERKGYDVVKEHWAAQMRAEGFEKDWRKALHSGVIAGTALPPRTLALRKDLRLPPPAQKRGSGLEILFRPDPTVWDGRFANNGWLQELPKPLTKLTWDNAILVSPAAAQRLGLANEQVAELRYGGRSVRGPVWILPGQAGNSVTVHLGYGRSRAGHLANGAGFNAYAIRTSDRPWAGDGVEIRKTGARRALACTQHHHGMEGRELVRQAPLDEFLKDPRFAQHVEPAPDPRLSLYPDVKYPGHSWGMAIDLNACMGCNACVVACQAENNIAVVGKTEVARGREMHWIRLDRYFEGGLDNPGTLHQPVLCMHCDNAPCEVVCPVAATVHSSEGLNQMVYNRCVGTRYCSNNCPYKVRRFNFFLFYDWESESLKAQRNPDVTVRSRGVMEKCTYCVQRINTVKIEAERDGRPVRDGEIRTACQAVCPTQAITFGDMNDPGSRVAKMKADPRNYGLLAHLNTKPRTTYLAKVNNPNPDLEAS